MSDDPSGNVSPSSALAAVPAPVRRPSHIRATWEGEHVFDTGRPDGPVARLDGSGHTAQSPPDALLSALAACSGVDVVDYLAKRRTAVTKLSIDVEADRREAHPRRFEQIRLRYDVQGASIERSHAERAVRLAFERYCSVAASLAPDIVIEAVVVLNGDEGTSLRLV
ncbi:MAG: OsmC family protein [Gemmatimonadota bacterium]|nr:OsmC family protein [Gemmatimonadota bacterium]